MEGLRFSNIDLSVKKQDQRAALVFDDVKELYLDGFSEKKNAGGAGSSMILRDVENALIRGCRPDSASSVFLRLEGHSKYITLVGNDLSRVEKKFELGPSVPDYVLYHNANR